MTHSYPVMKCCSRCALLVVLLASPLVQAVKAAEVTVEIFDFFFRPAEVTINAGDTVTWIQRGFNHNAAADDNSWRGPILSPGQRYSRVFNSPGNFPYHCDPHPWMQGTVIVRAAANNPPTVSITSPANNATFTAPAAITIQANAADADGSVARVEFFDGANSLGSDTSAPYSLEVTLAAGTHTLTARATDNAGASTTSAPVSVTVNAPNTPPTVSITSPANNATFTAPAAITIQANAADTDGSVARVEFFDGANSLGSDTSAPYSLDVTLAAGTHTLTARATDNAGATTTSAPITVTVNAPNTPPTVSITSPPNNATFTAPANVVIEATAADTDGTVAQVEFFAGRTLLGTATTSPFSVSATLAAGTHTLTARATDNAGASTTSAAVTITVNPANTPPTITILAPSNGATFTAPATLNFNALPSDSDGFVVQVEFFNGATSLGVDTSIPFGINITLDEGTHVLTAKATDNAGASTTSSSVTVTVTPPNRPPSVSILSPTNGVVFVAPATVTIEVTASDPDGTVTGAELFNGTNSMGVDLTPPFTFTATFEVGRYSLTARATDNAGAIATSAAVEIVVQAPNIAPSIAITNPPTGATLVAPASVTLQASAKDADGTIAKVEFFHGTNLVATLTNAPYAVTLTNLSMGTHTFSARATDQAGSATTSEPVTITVEAAPSEAVTLASAARLPNGQFQFVLNGSAGKTYRIQASSNLVDWATVQTNTVATPSAPIVVPEAASFAHRFYRVIEQ